MTGSVRYELSQNKSLKKMIMFIFKFSILSCILCKISWNISQEVIAS